jgi:hypothetical protein
MSNFNEKYNYLSENIDNFDEQKWNSIIDEITEEKEKLKEKLLIIKENVSLISIKLNKIKRKRIAKSKRNQIHKKLTEESFAQNKNAIDKWFDGKNYIKDRIKRESDLKLEADIVLIEVKNKLNVMKRYLKKVNSLEKARNALKNRAQQRSQFTSIESDSIFSNKINEIKTIIKERIEIYKKEENALKSMIQNKYEKSFNEKLILQNESLFNEVNQKQLNIYESLFGSNQFPEPNNRESLMNWQYFEQSHHNIDNMIRIRHLWDCYLDSNEGSAIPKNYVFPINTSNNDWNKYICK